MKQLTKINSLCHVGEFRQANLLKTVEEEAFPSANTVKLLLTPPSLCTIFLL